jgi:5,10-methenyltetrahydrofolate synthetase
VLAPLVGFDRQCYRLGYGGGYFDRTLAASAPRPLAIGVGFEFSLIETIYPQVFDIPMDLIVTEAELRRRIGRDWRE